MSGRGLYYRSNIVQIYDSKDIELFIKDLVYLLLKVD